MTVPRCFSSNDFRKSILAIGIVAPTLSITACQSVSPDRMWEGCIDRAQVKITEEKWKDAQELVDLANKEADRCSSVEVKRLEALRLQQQIHRGLKDWPSAINASNKILDLSLKLYDRRSKQSADALAGLAQDYVSAGQSAKAEELLIKSISVVQDKYGRDDIYLAKPLSTLGRLYYETDDPRRAAISLSRSLKIQKASLGNDNEELIETLLAYGNSLLQLNRGNESKAIFLEAKALAERTESLWLEDVLISLGDYESKAWKQASAFEFYQMAWKGKSRLKDNRYYLRLRLGGQLAFRGDYKSAAKYLNEIVSAHNRDPNIARRYMDQVYQILALFAEKQRHYEEAIGFLRKAIEFRKSAKSYLDDDSMILFNWQISEIYETTRDYYNQSKAIETACELLFERFQKGRTMNRGRLHIVMNSLLEFNSRHKQYEYCKKFLSRFEQLTRNDAKLSIYGSYYLGQYYEDARSTELSVQYYERCLEQCRKIHELYGVYGPVMMKLSAHYRKSGRVQEADKLDEDIRTWKTLGEKEATEIQNLESPTGGIGENSPKQQLMVPLRLP